MGDWIGPRAGVEVFGDEINLALHRIKPVAALPRLLSGLLHIT